MTPRSHPSFIDELLLDKLEHAFGEHAQGGPTIDVQRLQAVLGLKSEYLAARVLSVFDTNGDKLIDRAEFLAGVRRLISGSDREKLYFAFQLHDHDGDGAISEMEMLRMISLSLAEADVAEKASQPPEWLAHSLFAVADANRRDPPLLRRGRYRYRSPRLLLRTTCQALAAGRVIDAPLVLPSRSSIRTLDDYEATNFDSEHQHIWKTAIFTRG